MRWLAFLMLLGPQAPQQKFDPHELSGPLEPHEPISNVQQSCLPDKEMQRERPKLPSLLRGKGEVRSQ
jgi:hypothetical protein